MMALSALSVGNEANASSVRSLPGLIPALEAQLTVRCDIYTCASHEDPQLVVAMHTLVHTLGHMMVAASSDSPPPEYSDLYGSGAGQVGGSGGAAAAGGRAGLPGSISRRDQVRTRALASICQVCISSHRCLNLFKDRMPVLRAGFSQS